MESPMKVSVSSVSPWFNYPFASDAGWLPPEHLT